MVTTAQRITQLRTEKKLSKAQLSTTLGWSPNAIDRFEAGKQTPSKEQQTTLSNFFGVSVAFLRGETNDPTRQDSWMDMAYLSDEDEGPASQPVASKKKAAASNNDEETGIVSLQAPILQAFFKTDAGQDLLKKALSDFFSQSEGKKILQSFLRQNK